MLTKHFNGCLSVTSCPNVWSEASNTRNLPFKRLNIPVLHIYDFPILKSLNHNCFVVIISFNHLLRFLLFCLHFFVLFQFFWFYLALKDIFFSKVKTKTFLDNIVIQMFYIVFSPQWTYITNFQQWENVVFAVKRNQILNYCFPHTTILSLSRWWSSWRKNFVHNMLNSPQIKQEDYHLIICSQISTFLSV